MDSLVDRRVRVPKVATPILYRFIDYAAKGESDTLELTRGKSARVLGNLQTLMVLVKGLPLAYNRDLQEDKPTAF